MKNCAGLMGSLNYEKLQIFSSDLQGEQGEGLCILNPFLKIKY